MAFTKGFWLHTAGRRREGRIRPYFRGRRAGMSNLNEGQKLSYDVVSERGKLAAANLRNV